MPLYIIESRAQASFGLVRGGSEAGKIDVASLIYYIKREECYSHSSVDRRPCFPYFKVGPVSTTNYSRPFSLVSKLIIPPFASAFSAAIGGKHRQ